MHWRFFLIVETRIRCCREGVGVGSAQRICGAPSRRRKFCSHRGWLQQSDKSFCQVVGRQDRCCPFDGHPFGPSRVQTGTGGRRQKAVHSERSHTRPAGFYGFLGSDVAVNLRPMPEPSKIAPKALDRRSQHRLLRAASLSPKAAALVARMLLAGLRIGEAVAVKVGDVEIAERSGTVTVRMGKGGRRRRVPLNATARRIILPWWEGRFKESGEGAWLFPGRGNTGRLTERGGRHMLAELAVRSVVEGVHPHALRHTFATGPGVGWRPPGPGGASFGT